MMKRLTPLSLLCLSLLCLSIWAGAHAAPQTYVDVSQLSTSSLVTQAIRHEHGEGVPKNAARAVELYCAAARMGNIEAAYRLGWMYANGRGLSRSDEHAVALFTRAANQGHADAKRMLSLISAKDMQLPPCLAPVPAPADAAVAGSTAQTARADSPFQTLQTPQTQAAPAPTVAPLAQPATARAREHQDIAAVIAQWANAWSKKDVDAYIGSYAKTFVVPGGRSLQQWRLERRARISGKSWITVTINALDITVVGQNARATFQQHYRSDQLVEVSSKTLELVKVGGHWLIQRERSAE